MHEEVLNKSLICFCQIDEKTEDGWQEQRRDGQD